MKYPKIEEPVFVSKVTHREGKDTNNLVEVEFTGITTQTTYKTYLDPKFANWPQWEMIINTSETKGVVLDNLKLKDPDKNLVNADSRPRVKYAVPKEDFVDIMSDYWASREKFNRLFT